MVIVNDVKESILRFIQSKGPSLPIQIAKELNMNSLFISAFLSELADEKKIKVSSLKVGGSPLYFLESQEQQLEKFYSYLHPKEAEAYLFLKENKILKDSEQEPAVRVALRAIKDFARGLSKNNEIFWRYILVSEEEAYHLIDKKYLQKQEILPEKIKQETVIISAQPEKINPPEEAKKSEPEKFKEEKPVKIKPKKQEKLIKETGFQNPLVVKPIEKPVKEKPKSEFVLKAIEFLRNNHFRLIEEKDFKAKEYLCISQVNTALGPINFLTEAKDKKIISDTDLQKFLSDAQSIPLPALVLYTNGLSKKAQEYLEKYSSILKAKKIE